jgi:putative ABC transport system substrate-binding protein
VKTISTAQPAVSKNVFCLVTLLLAFGLSAEAQQSQKIPRVGFLLAPSPAAVVEPLNAFRQGMRELGYIEGKNVIVEYRSAEGKRDRLPGLAAELVRLKVDVIVATGGPQTVQTAKNVTSTIPIVMTGMGDPIMTGLIVSYARPGGNITGITLGGLDLYGKRLEVLKEAVPRVAHVAFFVDPTSLGGGLWLKAMEPSAQVLGLKSVPLQFGASKISTVRFKLQSNGTPMVSSLPETPNLPIAEKSF